MNLIYVVMFKGKGNILAYSANFWLSKESAEAELKGVYGDSWELKYDIVPLVSR